MPRPKHRLLQGIVLAALIPFVQTEATSFDADLDPQTEIRNVILVTWDGVRRQEFFDGPDHTLSEGDYEDTLPWFRSNFEQFGKTYGGHGNTMTVGNTVMMSLPGYQSIFAGRPTSCFDNYCGRIEISTFSERIVQALGLERQKVAHIASWYPMKFAAERRKGSVFTNTGFEYLKDKNPDNVQDQLNKEQSEQLPQWPAARYDRFTVKQAMHYLKKHQPRFMHIGLNDSDEWGHRGDYRNYLISLRQYDEWLKELVEQLAVMGEYGRNTCLLVTTDHGRGDSEKWTKHSNGVVESGLVWLHASCPFLEGEVTFVDRQYLTTHLDIRPTIEDLMGLRPRGCVGCGSSLVERRTKN